MSWPRIFFIKTPYQSSTCTNKILWSERKQNRFKKLFPADNLIKLKYEKWSGHTQHSYIVKKTQKKFGATCQESSK